MPEPNFDIEQLLQKYLRERDAQADQAARSRPLQLEPLLAEVRQRRTAAANAPQSPALEAVLENYVKERDAAAERVPPLHRADVNLLLSEVRDARQRRERASPSAERAGWWQRFRLPWLVAVPACVVVAALLIIVLGPGLQRRTGPLVVNGSNAPSLHVLLAFAGPDRSSSPPEAPWLATPLSAYLQFQQSQATLRLVERGGTNSYAGPLSDETTEQTEPWRRNFAFTAVGTNSLGQAVELKGRFKINTEGPAGERARATNVLGAVVEISSAVVAGKTVSLPRLESIKPP